MATAAMRLARRHDVEASTNRTDLRAALDHVDRFGEHALGHARIGVEIEHLDRAAHRHNFTRRLARPRHVLRLADRVEDGELLPFAHRNAGAEDQDDVVALGQHHLLFVRAHELTPHVSLRVAEETLITQEYRVSRHQWSAIDERARSANRRRGARAARERERLLSRAVRVRQAHLVARINPMRIGDLRVVAPDLRPRPGVLVVVVAQIPQRIAAPNEVNVGTALGALASASSGKIAVRADGSSGAGAGAAAAAHW